MNVSDYIGLGVLCAIAYFVIKLSGILNAPLREVGIFLTTPPASPENPPEPIWTPIVFEPSGLGYVAWQDWLKRHGNV